MSEIDFTVSRASLLCTALAFDRWHRATGSLRVPVDMFMLTLTESMAVYGAQLTPRKAIKLIGSLSDAGVVELFSRGLVVTKPVLADVHLQIGIGPNAVEQITLHDPIVAMSVDLMRTSNSTGKQIDDLECDICKKKIIKTHGLGSKTRKVVRFESGSLGASGFVPGDHIGYFHSDCIERLVGTPRAFFD